MNKQKEVHGHSKPMLTKGRTAKRCICCGVWFSLPTCHSDRHSSCSSECQKRRRKEALESRRRMCSVCGKSFVPRLSQIRNGAGRYCSVTCLSKESVAWIHNDGSRKKAQEARRTSLAAGKWSVLSGENNPLWKGGPKACLARRIASGKTAEYTKSYRAANPDRVRGWAHKRREHGKVLSRLPYGTIPKLRKNQGNKCIYCDFCLDDVYHVDHILPIALGGKHEPSNLQLLCPTCNLRKSSKHPEDFAQSLGLLL